MPHTFISISSLPKEFWIACLCISFISTPIETVFYYEALKHEEVSIVIPLLSIAPIITMFLGSLLLKESPSLFGVIGVFLIIFGIYILKLHEAKEGIFKPFMQLKKSKGVRLMSIVVLSYGFSAVLDKIGISYSNAFFYSLINYICLSLVLFIIMIIKAKNHLHQLTKYSYQFLLIGFFVAGYTILYTLSLQFGNTAYAVAIKNASIIFTILLSYFLFKEQHLKQKILAGIIIIAGLLCIKLFG